MNVDDVVGYYTYRSFLDRVVGTPSDILWGEGELLLAISDEGQVTGTLAFPADAGAEQKLFMDLSGTVSAWSPLSLRFIGKGRAGTAIGDYEYEYDCRVTHEWESATPAQRTSLVGTVRRNKDHGEAKAGATASFIAVKRDFVEPRDIPGVALIPEVIAMLGERAHRLRHTAWHTVRGDWQSPKMTEADRKRLKELGWYLTDPPFTPAGTLDLTNGAGEDFLYMHRRMIRMVHEVYDEARQPRPTSWSELPAASSPQYDYREVPDPTDPTRKVFVLDPASSGNMVPPPTKELMSQLGGIPFFRFNKTPRGLANLMRNVAANLRNPRVMSQLTLGAYGNLIEFTVHNWMHMRWATLARNPTTGTAGMRDSYDIDRQWDTPSYDYLGDFHSSHVNPLFWRLHGWVDDCIDRWYQAHESAHPGMVKRAEVRGIAWFEPGPWVIKADPFDWPGAGHGHGGHGGHGDHGHGGHDHGGHGHGGHGQGGHGGHGGDEIATLEKVMALLKEIDARPTEGGLKAAQAFTATRRLPGFARFLVDPTSDEP